MRQHMDLTFWVAVAALLLAIWAMVRQSSWAADHKWLHERSAETRAVYLEEMEKRIACMETQVAALSRAPAVESDVPVWEIYDVIGGLPVLRTPSGDRPEVRNVEEGKP